MSFRTENLHFTSKSNVHVHYFLLLLLLFHIIPSYGLNEDGILLLSFKYSVLSDPLTVLDNWNYEDQTPCSWKGVKCAGFRHQGMANESRVVELVLPGNRIASEIPGNLFMIEHLRRLDLSNNFINGTLPNSLFNGSELQILAISNNLITGHLPDSLYNLQSLQLLNLADNSLTGDIPSNLSSLRNLTVLSLKSNYLSGKLPGGFDSIQVLDLSSNLINGSLPLDFAGQSIRYLNLSHNSISGEIPIEFADQLPENITLDLSFNNLTGKVPETESFLSQKTESLDGNPNLCGKPLKNPCSVLSNPANSSPTSPAIAVLPKPSSNGSPESTTTTAEAASESRGKKGLKPGTIMGIIAGDVAIIAIVSLIFLYLCKSKKNKKNKSIETNSSAIAIQKEPNSRGFSFSCFRKEGDNDGETSETTSSDSETQNEEEDEMGINNQNQKQQQKGGRLVTVDGETELELETLLRASAYIIGASGSSIVYKAVLEDGTTFAVRRIGESRIEKFKEFENQVRVIAKMRHPNLVRVRGFYWGSDEKLVIYDHVANGSLANITYRKKRASTPSCLPWEARLRIARGIARGLSYVHDKKHVHGNIKPSNILLGLDMEPYISDFGLERLMCGDNATKKGGSAQNFGSHRSTASAESLQDLHNGASSSPALGTIVGPSSYRTLESLQNLKPNPKWDVYSFGVVLMELLTGKILSEQELGQGNTGSWVEDQNRVLKMVDTSIKKEMEGKEEILVTCLKIGFSCVSSAPQRRPSMKEVLQILEKIPSS